MQRNTKKMNRCEEPRDWRTATDLWSANKNFADTIRQEWGRLIAMNKKKFANRLA